MLQRNPFFIILIALALFGLATSLLNPLQFLANVLLYAAVILVFVLIYRYGIRKRPFYIRSWLHRLKQQPSHRNQTQANTTYQRMSQHKRDKNAQKKRQRFKVINGKKDSH